MKNNKYKLYMLIKYKCINEITLEIDLDLNKEELKEYLYLIIDLYVTNSTTEIFIQINLLYGTKILDDKDLSIDIINEIINELDDCFVRKILIEILDNTRW